MASVEQIMKEALTLPSAARALLAEKLVESLEFDVDETLQTLWTDEAKKRRDEVRSGAVSPIPGEEGTLKFAPLLPILGEGVGG
ncbi:MAG: addiction module protein [Nostoc sp. DedSLP03]|uniref:addiction module protein n=1 Tax=Nostoc sp. DedSLP03 TaxID=3075400 RepID=UPI002AD4FEBD|nr:addiction module protein [Nostoc sp. DedSLP03]MDZ7963447.1 addiction module protein [Nostoc sp. DedSLP03]